MSAGAPLRPVVMRKFLVVTDSEDEAGIGWMLQLSRLDHRDMGRVLATYRAWPGPLFWVPFGVIWAPQLALLALSPTRDELVVRLGFVVILAVFSAVPLIAYGMERHRVCEHGLVLGFREKSTLVIPWATIDPGRIRIAHNMGLLGRHPGVAQMSSRNRVGVFGLQGLVLNGLDAAISSGWNVEPNSVHTHYAWWLLGTRRADRLVADIERAMIVDGYPARGLAARAKEQTLHVRWKPARTNPLPVRRSFDPVLGVDGPLMADMD